jgi:hypothetical protein
MREALLVIVLLLTACVPSLHPLYTEADLTADSKLVGTWIDKETGESWTFSPTDKLKYSLVHVDSDGRKEQYTARLVKLDDKLFLDLVAIKPGVSQNDQHRDGFISTHTFVYVVSEESKVQISYMEPRWLKDYLSQDPSAIRHENVGGEIILTSSPKETQKFVLSHLTTHEAFSKPTELTLKRGAP